MYCELQYCADERVSTGEILSREHGLYEVQYNVPNRVGEMMTIYITYDGQPINDRCVPKTACSVSCLCPRNYCCMRTTRIASSKVHAQYCTH
jgi:hypothetical protein